MKKFILFVTIAMIYSCVKEPNVELLIKKVKVPQRITVSYESINSRTHVQNKTLYWSSNDKISCFPGVNANVEYRISEENISTYVIFERVGKENIEGTALAYNYAIYPYATTTNIVGDDNIWYNLPTVQTYQTDSFGLSANPMVCTTDNTKVLEFKNICGYLTLKLYGQNITVKSILLKGNNNEKISGSAIIRSPIGEIPMITMNEDSNTELLLDCINGVTLESTADKATTFWFVLPPTKFENGFTISVTDINGNSYNKTTFNTFTIERNIIQPMKALEVNFKRDKPANNEIWYTTLSNNVEFPYGNNVFGANIIFNTYENDKGVIRFDNDITSIGQYAFFMKNELLSLTIPDSVTSISSHAFYDCINLTKVDIGEGVNTIGGGAFFNCTSLEDIVIPNGVTSIEYTVFEGCSSLTSISIPDSVTTIGDMAFRDCYNLTSVSIGNGVTSIGAIPFLGCKNLRAFYGKFASEDNRYITVNGVLHSFASAGLEEYNIPDGVIEIGKQAFDGANLIKVIIPSSVTKIQMYAFTNCRSLINITLPNSISQIPQGTFQNCSSLTHITIPENVTKIGSSAFSRCTSLISIYCEPTTPPKGSKDMFYNIASEYTIYVPRNSVEAYKSAEDWKEYAKDIVGYDF